MNGGDYHAKTVANNCEREILLFINFMMVPAIEVSKLMACMLMID